MLAKRDTLKNFFIHEPKNCNVSLGDFGKMAGAITEMSPKLC